MKKVILMITVFIFAFAVSAQTPNQKTVTKKEVKQEVKQVKQDVKQAVKPEHKCTGEGKGEHKCADKAKDHKCTGEGKGEHKCAGDGKGEHKCAGEGTGEHKCTGEHKDDPNHVCCGEHKEGGCCKDKKQDFGQNRAKAATTKVEKECVVKEVAAEVDQAVVKTKTRTQEARTAIQDKYKKKQITKAQYEEKMKRIDEIEKEVIRIENDRKTTDKVIKAKVS